MQARFRFTNHPDLLCSAGSRLSTIQGADLIAVVRAGEVVEQGSHAELIANPTGAYTTLVKLQMQAAEKAKDDDDVDDADGDEDVSIHRVQCSTSMKLQSMYYLACLPGSVSDTHTARIGCGKYVVIQAI